MFHQTQDTLTRLLRAAAKVYNIYPTLSPNILYTNIIRLSFSRHLDLYGSLLKENFVSKMWFHELCVKWMEQWINFNAVQNKHMLVT